MTGEDPAFVLVDLHGRLIVFLNSPADPEEHEVPVWFAMKAINSLIIKSLAITAIKNPFTLVFRAFWHIGNSEAAVVLRTGRKTSPNLRLRLLTGPGMDLAKMEAALDHIVRVPSVTRGILIC